MAFPGGARPQPQNRAQRNAGGRGQRTAARPRARQQQLPSIYDPTQQLSGRSLRGGARALTNLEINPQVSQLSRQIARINSQRDQAQAQTAAYFRDLGARAQQAYADQQGSSANLNRTLAGIGADTQATIGTAGQTAQQALAPLQATGLGGGGFEALVREIAAQQANAAQGSQAARNFGATQGANYEGLSASQIGTGASRGQERLSELGNAFALQAQEPQGRIADLLAGRGATYVKNLGALRDSERNYGLARDTLGLNTQKAVFGAQNNAANRQQRAQQFNIQQALRDGQFRLDVARYGLTAAKDRYQRTHGLGPYALPGGRGGALTGTQRHAAFASIDSATSVIRQLRARGYGTGDIRKVLANGYYVVSNRDPTTGRVTNQRYPVARVGDKTLVNAAMDLALNGRLSQANVNALHNYGLKIRGRYAYDTGRRYMPPGGTGPPSPVLG